MPSRRRLPRSRKTVWSFRPIITSLLLVVLLGTSAWLVLEKFLAADIWFTYWSQTLGMMIGFYFAVRSDDKRKEDVLPKKVEVHQCQPSPAPNISTGT